MQPTELRDLRLKCEGASRRVRVEVSAPSEPGSRQRRGDHRAVSGLGAPELRGPGAKIHNGKAVARDERVRCCA